MPVLQLLHTLYGLYDVLSLWMYIIMQSNNALLLCMYILTDVQAIPNGTLQLVGGSTYRSGRVEVYISSGQSSGWHTVCSNSAWDKADASVACKQLGFGSYATAISDNNSSVFDNSSAFLTDLECNGDESKLLHCNHNITEHQHCNKSAELTCGGSFPS